MSNLRSQSTSGKLSRQPSERILLVVIDPEPPPRRRRRKPPKTDQPIHFQNTPTRQEQLPFMNLV